jgi:hypothetical protein
MRWVEGAEVRLYRQELVQGQKNRETWLPERLWFLQIKGVYPADLRVCQGLTGISPIEPHQTPDGKKRVKIR